MSAKMATNAIASRRMLAFTAYLMRDLEQQSDDDEIGHDGTSAVAQERKGNTRQWYQSRVSPNDDDRLNREHGHQARRQQFLETVSCCHSDIQAPKDEDQIGGQKGQ